MRWQLAALPAFADAGGRILAGQIAPALMRAAVGRRQYLELVRTDDVEPPVLAILKTQDRLPRNDAMLDDPVQRAADQFVLPFRPHPRRHAQFALVGPRRNAPGKGFDMRAADSDLGEMKGRHGS